MSDVKLYRLVSGEEILATVVGTTPDYIEIKDSVVLVYQRAAEDKMSVGFAPFMPYATGNVTLYSRSIESVATCSDQLLGEYNRVFSKIQIAPASMLAGLQ